MDLGMCKYCKYLEVMHNVHNVDITHRYNFLIKAGSFNFSEDKDGKYRILVSGDNAGCLNKGNVERYKENGVFDCEGFETADGKTY